MRILNNIFLIGPMGVGKTTIARHLADELNMRFIDSDHEIEKQAGVTIPFIFELEGEIGFRQREQAIIAELTAKSHIILSTGGGVVLNVNNRRLLQNRGEDQLPTALMNSIKPTPNSIECNISFFSTPLLESEFSEFENFQN
jgi:shikimate kinase